MKEISPKKYNERKFKSLLVKALRKTAKGATLHDMVVASGLPSEWVEFTVRKLLGDYPCRLRTNSKGELVYIFNLEKPKKNLKQLLLTWAKPTLGKDRLQKQKKVVYQVLSYIFGELKNAQDRLFTEKIILSYLRNNQGKIVIAELIQITGWSVYTAETQAARLLADFQGEVSVTEEGVIIYEFEDLVQMNAESGEICESLKIWERPTPERKMNDNDELTNHQLEKINKYNLALSSLSSFVLGALFFNQQAGLLMNLLFATSSVALSFSSVFFLVPAVRQFFVQMENEKIRMHNVETFMLKGIFNRIQSQIYPEKDLKKLIFESKPLKNYHYWWNRFIPLSLFEYSFILTSTYQREVLLEKKALELEAEISVDEKGNLYYDFERLKRELDIIGKKRGLSLSVKK